MTPVTRKELEAVDRLFLLCELKQVHPNKNWYAMVFQHKYAQLLN